MPRSFHIVYVLMNNKIRLLVAVRKRSGMIMRVNVEKEAYEYAICHQILPQLLKAVLKIKAGNNRGVDLKKRKPKSKGIWSFRITKKYRAFARRKGNVLSIYTLDDHQ
jgi:hypothetical protein